MIPDRFHHDQSHMQNEGELLLRDNLFMYSLGISAPHGQCRTQIRFDRKIYVHAYIYERIACDWSLNMCVGGICNLRDAKQKSVSNVR